MTRRTASPTPRRNNAPIRRRKAATSVPDFLVACAIAAWVLSAVFIAASFVDASLAHDGPGKTIARMFAGLLLAAGVFIIAIAMLLLRDDRGNPDHYLVPAVIGMIVGAVEAVLFLWPAGNLVWAPLLLLALALRPLRRLVGRIVGMPARR